jgi:glycosyltransferase involved in cell wall biosynthesis
VEQLHDAAPAAPRLTIAIPTFRRLTLLLEAIRSAVAQRDAGSFEILVTDNDPASADWANMLALAPELQDAPIRYVVNAENIGMFGNWNRCIELARGEWLTILNDDDLLDPDFVATMFALLHRGLDGIACRKRTLDERAQPTLPGAGRRARALARDGMTAVMFRGRPWRRITARHMFWGNPLGNPVGFVARTAAFRELGGFYPEDYPSADYYFFTRLVLRGRVTQTRAVHASIRLSENESMRPDTMFGFLETEYRLQQRLAGSVLPRAWRHISPALIDYHMRGIERTWQMRIDPAEVAARIGVLPRGGGAGLHAIRMLLGGF